MRPASLAALVLLAVLLPAGSAHAACFSSTPSTATFADPPADGDAALAPEILAVGATTDAACRLAVQAVLADAAVPGDLIEGDSVGIYLDTDGNPATGAQLWSGADRVAIVVGRIGPDLGPALGVWNGAEFDFAGAAPLAPVGAGGFSAPVDQLGMQAPASVGVRTITLWQGIYDDYADFAPEALAPSFQFPVAFSTAAPPPLPPPAPPVAPPAPPVATPPVKKTSACTVPRVKRLRSAKARRQLRRAGCRYRVVRVRSPRAAGRVVSTRPRAGRRTSRVVRVTISRGRRQRAMVSALALAAVERRLSAAAGVRSAAG
jgi:hypothetical protein